MALDVESPDPPDLTNRGLPSEFETPEVPGASNLRREELEEILQDGAWSEAFSEWATYTDLTEEEYQTIRNRGLFEQLDFYWDPVEKRLRFEVPNPPAEWSTREDLVSNTRAELTDLGHAVVEMLMDAYVDWGEEETSDAVWREEALGEESPYKD